MSVPSQYIPRDERFDQRNFRGPDDYDDAAGWWTFAGIVLAIAGILNLVYGVAAVGNATFYTNNAHYVFSDLKTWGWILIAIGVIQVVGSAALFLDFSIGRWIGIASASANAIAQLLSIQSYPLLSLALFSLDLIVIYGLATHGSRQSGTA